MKKLTLFFLILFTCKGIAQLPAKLDSLMPEYEKLKEDTLKVEKFLFVATQLATIDTTLSGKYGRRAYSLALKINDIKGIGNSYNYFGTRYYYVQDYNNAINCFEKAASYFSQCKYLKGSASSLNNCGAIYTEKGEFDKAIEYQKKSLIINQQLKNNDAIAGNYLNIGNVYNLKGDYKIAMSNLLKAEPIYQKVQNWEGLATTYYNIAYVLYNMKQYDKAIEYCEKSLRIREEKSFNKIGMAYSHVFLASIYSDTVKFDLNKAKYHYKRVIEICHETGDRITLLSALINTAKNYLNQNKLDSALNYAKQSLTLSRELGNQKFLTGTLFQLGDILIQLKKYKEAIPYFQEGYTISKEIEDLAFICNNAKGLATSYYSLGDYKNGYDNLFIYTKQKDELYNKENVQAISDMEAKYQNEKKQLEIEGLNKDKQLQQLQLTSQQKENESKNKLLIFGAISLLGISVFAFFAYHNFQKTKKQNLIIENQKQQVELKNEEIVHQKELVEEKATELAVKQKEIIDSINYAKRIQQAVLTGEEVWNKISPEHFILFMPKDIVSGDFYWAYHTPNNRSIFVLADCTGHGVPGGFMSMLGNSFLNEIIVEGKIFKADEILNKLRAKIISALEQKGATEQKDGMDMALCVWNKLDNTLEFAGANNPLWLVRNNELIEYKANKMPIGTYLENNKPFTSATINLQKGDTIYLTTDGYADQFGGENGKKLKYKTLIEHLLKINHQDMPQQKQRLEKLFLDWRGKYDQIDDVSVIGIRV